MAIRQTKRPNFFIVGAPKCATTALYTYLSDHPSIFMPHVKEPHFFATDFILPKRVEKLEDYLALFRSSKSAQTTLGEASVHYLVSNVAIKNIYEFAPNAKIIAMLRNPIDLAHSLHSQRMYTFQEDVEDFESAWRLQAPRLKGENIPVQCTEPQLLQYERMSKLGEQVERLLAVFPQEQVKLVLFEDFITSTKAIYDDILTFLGVDLDNRTVFPRVNENKKHQIPFLGKLMWNPPYPLLVVKKALRLKRYSGLGKLLYELNTKPEKRTPIRQEFRNELLSVFRSDIMKLQHILNRDLSHWR